MQAHISVICLLLFRLRRGGICASAHIRAGLPSVFSSHNPLKCLPPDPCFPTPPTIHPSIKTAVTFYTSWFIWVKSSHSSLHTQTHTFLGFRHTHTHTHQTFHTHTNIYSFQLSTTVYIHIKYIFAVEILFRAACGSGGIAGWLETEGLVV